MPLDTSVELETPEHITFRYQLAGPARRAAAYAVDLCIRAVLLLIAAIVIGLTTSSSASDLRGFETGALLLIFFALEWGYFVSFDIFASGASPGKRAFRLRAIHQDGRPISLSDSVLRNLLRAADLLPMFYAIGVLSMMFDSKFRRLGDLVAQTIVVYEPVIQLKTAAQSHSARAITALPARPQLNRAERQALALYSRRIKDLSRARALELAELVAPLFVERFSLQNPDKVDLLIALHEGSQGQ